MKWYIVQVVSAVNCVSCLIAIFLFISLLIVAGCYLVVEDDEYEIKMLKVILVLFTLFIISLLLTIFVPSGETMKKIFELTA